MYKRIQQYLRTNEEEEEFHDWNQMYVQQEMESDVECYACSLCEMQFGKNDQELEAHLNSIQHKKQELQFTKRYNTLIQQYKISTYTKKIGRKLKKLKYFKCIYEYK